MSTFNDRIFRAERISGLSSFLVAQSSVSLHLLIAFLCMLMCRKTVNQAINQWILNCPGMYRIVAAVNLNELGSRLTAMVLSRSALHSASSYHILILPVRRSTVSAGAFPVSGPALWNCLPADITSIQSASLPVLRRRLKNYLFLYTRIQAPFNNCISFSIVA